jgi:hypothetical protein
MAKKQYQLVIRGPRLGRWELKRLKEWIGHEGVIPEGSTVKVEADDFLDRLFGPTGFDPRAYLGRTLSMALAYIHSGSPKAPEYLAILPALLDLRMRAQAAGLDVEGFTFRCGTAERLVGPERKLGDLFQEAFETLGGSRKDFEEQWCQKLAVKELPGPIRTKSLLETSSLCAKE